MADRYAVPGSPGVLRNRRGFTDAAALAEFELAASLTRVAELRRSPITGSFDLDHLRAIHRHVFQDVYDWAGELRTVATDKGMPYCLPHLLASQAPKVFAAIADDDYLAGLDRDAFVARLADHWGEVNALHPFREGNTRAQRVFFAQLADVAGWPIDWARLDYEAFVAARHENLLPARSDALAAVLDPAVAH